ncbi:hypothetical protein GWK47_039929 [Chionoecetes opilio]|uniref:Uncharacterized protein n=1 Tax=Chionoecetes opilio TaxID=41210 RepID=A0A8J4YCH7_CHIOP|nr:hypothetical protein GWK47_039929 [Chionoecetes opilio]
MATAIYPLFKLPVVLLLNPEKVDAVISRLLFDVTEQAVLDTSEGSSPDEDEEDSFFKSLRSPGTHSYRGHNCTRFSNKMGKELESWCSLKLRNKLLEQAMFLALSLAAWVDVVRKVQHGHTQLCSRGETVLLGVGHHEGQRASLTSDNLRDWSSRRGNMDLLNK